MAPRRPSPESPRDPLRRPCAGDDQDELTGSKRSLVVPKRNGDDPADQQLRQSKRRLAGIDHARRQVGDGPRIDVAVVQSQGRPEVEGGDAREGKDHERTGADRPNVPTRRDQLRRCPGC